MEILGCGLWFDLAECKMWEWVHPTINLEWIVGRITTIEEGEPGVVQ